MSITNIVEKKPNQEDAINLIEAIESDFSDVERVLIKADWVMKNCVQKLQSNQLSEQERMLLITQLNAAVNSIQDHLYQGILQTKDGESNVA